MDNIEADLKEIIKSDGCNEMQFNESKIQLLTYGKNTDLKAEPSHNICSPNLDPTYAERYRI